MNKDLFLDGEKFISAKRGAQITGYTEDYIGQLARGGRMPSKKLGRTWYVSKKSLLDHKKLGGKVVEQSSAIKSSPVTKDIFLNGEKYISTKEAAQAAGYTEDYVGQLARGGALQSKMVGRAWYVSRRSILAHKKTNSLRVTAPVKRFAPVERLEQPTEIKKVPSAKVPELPLPGITRPLSLPPITGYACEKVSVLPVLTKKLPIKIWGLRKAVVKEAVVAAVSMLIITSSALSWVDHFSPALADRTLDRLEEISNKEQALLATAIGAVNPYRHLAGLAFFSDVKGGFLIALEFFRDEIFYASAPLEEMVVEVPETPILAATSTAPSVSTEIVREIVKETVVENRIAYYEDPVLRDEIESLRRQFASLDFLNVQTDAVFDSMEQNIENISALEDLTLSDTLTGVDALFSSTLDVGGLLTFGTAVGTSATTTNFFSTTASSTNLFATNFTLGTGTVGPLTITGNVEALDDTIDIGTPGVRFDKFYANEVNATTLVGTLTGGNLTAETFSINSDNATADTENAFLAFERGTEIPNALLMWDATSDLFDFNFGLEVNGSLLTTGSSTLQSLTFTNATGTSATTTNLYFSNSLTGPSNFIINSSGNVGIGTTTPGARLEVKGTGTGSFMAGAWAGDASYGALSINGNMGLGANMYTPYGGSTLYINRPTGGAIRFREENGTDQVSIESGGNVGIGISDPNYKLDVNGTIGVTGSIIGQASPYLDIYTNSSDAADNRITRIGGGGDVSTTRGSFATFYGNEVVGGIGGDLYLTPGGTGDVVVPSGNVGIGTTTPGAPLEVARQHGAGNDAWMSFNNYSAGGYGDWTIGKAGNNDLTFYNSSTDGLSAMTNPRVTFDYDGNVGIGTSTPAREVHIQSTGNADLQFTNGSNWKSWHMGNSTSDFAFVETGVDTRMTLEAGGNVGIGTTAPGAKLDVKLSSAQTGQFTAGHEVFTLSNTDTTANNWGSIVFNDSASGAYTTAIQTKYTDHTNDYGELHFSTRGSSGLATRLMIQENGNVGIGTTAPGRTSFDANSKIVTIETGSANRAGVLELVGLSGSNVGAGNPTGIIRFGNNISGTGDELAEIRIWNSDATNQNDGYLSLMTADAGVLDSRLTISNTGNVGIGTTTPTDLLHIQGTSGTYVTIGSSGANTLDRGIRFKNQVGTDAGFITLVPNSVGTDSIMHFYVGGSSASDIKQTILDTGYVGIGDTTPTEGRLTVVNTGATAALYVKGGDDGTGSWAAQIVTASANPILMARGDGYVGIGTASPVTLTEITGSSPYLTIANSSTDVTLGMPLGVLNFYSKDPSTNSIGGVGGIRLEAEAAFNSGNTPTYMAFYTHDNSGNDGTVLGDVTERMRITAAGSVGVGDTTPDALLDVKGTVCLDLNADEACTDNTAAISDARLKTNVLNLTGGLELVKQLKPVYFTWNGEYNTGTSDSLGFLAQEVEIIFPELVITDTAGYKNLDYGKLTAVLAGAIQELDQKIENIELDLASASTSLTISTSTPGFLAAVSEAIGDTIFALLRADEVRTDKLCVEDVCVTRDRFLEIVGSGNSGGVIVGDSDGGSSDPVSEPPLESASSTPPSSVSDGADAASEPEPEPEPEQPVADTEPAPTEEPTSTDSTTTT